MATQPFCAGCRLPPRQARPRHWFGSSGAGKSTVFHLLTGLMEPASGVIRIGGVLPQPRAQRSARNCLPPSRKTRRCLMRLLPRTSPLAAAFAPDALDPPPCVPPMSRIFLPCGARRRYPGRPARLCSLHAAHRHAWRFAPALVQTRPCCYWMRHLGPWMRSPNPSWPEALALGKPRPHHFGDRARLATVRDADNRGDGSRRVAETGTHDQLLAQGGLYAGLYRLQFKD